MDLLRLVLDARRVSPITATNAVTIKDTPERIAAAARVVSAIDKARPGSHHRRRTAGDRPDEADRVRAAARLARLARPQRIGHVNTAPNSNADARRRCATSRRPTSCSPICRRSTTACSRRTRTRAMLANPQLRTSEGMHGAGAVRRSRADSGDDVRADRHGRCAAAAHDVVQLRKHRREHRHHAAHASRRRRHARAQHRRDELSGTGFGGLPTLGNREVKNQIRLRDGETNMLAGLIRDDERKSLDGIPGLSDIPGVGRFFAHTT